MTAEVARSPTAQLIPTTIFAPTPKAEKRFWEFFTTQVSNDHTRRAYLTAVKRFSEWCGLMGVAELGQVQPMHVAAYLSARRESLRPDRQAALGGVANVVRLAGCGAGAGDEPGACGARVQALDEEGQDGGAVGEGGPNADRRDRDGYPDRFARPRLDRADGVHVRPRGRGVEDARGGLFRAGTAWLGAAA